MTRLSTTLEQVFRRIVAARIPVLGLYALLLAVAVPCALRIEQDNSLDRLIDEGDPDAVTASEFARTFGHGEYVLVATEAPDPFAPATLARFDALGRALAAVPGARVSSALQVFYRARAVFEITPESAAAFQSFALGTNLFRRQGLVSERGLSIALILDVKSREERHVSLAAIDRAVAVAISPPSPMSAVRKVGQPYVNDALDQGTASGAWRYFPLFLAFVVLLNLLLYRSWRTLAAFLATLGTSAGLTLGFIGATGGVFTIVSSLVPMTVLITCTATLVYIHSRFVECPAGRALDEHHAFALADKFVACSASIAAGAVGFAALAVSKIRPIRELGIWVAAGLVITWLVAFTLFPALQRVLRTPTSAERRIAGARLVRIGERLPAFSYRFRLVLVIAALALIASGAVALFGVPGLLAPMRIATDPLEYLDQASALYRDTRALEERGPGLAMTEVWLRGGQPGSVTEPTMLRGLARFEDALEKEDGAGAAVGLGTVARTIRYGGGGGDALPDDDERLEALGDLIVMQLGREPMLEGYVARDTLAETHVSVITRSLDHDGYRDLDRRIRARWAAIASQDPRLAGVTVTTTGSAALQAKISYHLVPTLVESFALSVVIIYGAFLLVFRSGAARLLAMIPSLLAILAMFLVIRLVGMRLNVATILIASTVLGTSENDQIHFFYHFLERRKTASLDESLRHALRVAGRAIVFATLINAGGFLAFTMANLPPIRQFGGLSALAFVISMIADFTALPAALWLVLRARPTAESPAHSGSGDELTQSAFPEARSRSALPLP